MGDAERLCYRVPAAAGATGMMRARAIVAVALAVLALPHPARAGQVYTTFEHASEGCAGGSDVCGPFPLVRLGAATYHHDATADGVVEAAAETDGGVREACAGAACLGVARYHAEATARVWVDVPVVAGTRSVHVTVEHAADAFSTAEEHGPLGDGEAVLDGSVDVADAPGSSLRCSDGSEVHGDGYFGVLGEHGYDAEPLVALVRCLNEGASLTDGTLRIGLTVRAKATSAGGEAGAGVVARLVSVTVETA